MLFPDKTTRYFLSDVLTYASPLLFNNMYITWQLTSYRAVDEARKQGVTTTFPAVQRHSLHKQPSLSLYALAHLYLAFTQATRGLLCGNYTSSYVPFKSNRSGSRSHFQRVAEVFHCRWDQHFLCIIRQPLMLIVSVSWCLF